MKRTDWRRERFDEVRRALPEVDLSVLIRQVETEIRRRRRPSHPASYLGLTRYMEMVANLRDGLAPDGWTAFREHGVEGVEHQDLGVRLLSWAGVTDDAATYVETWEKGPVSTTLLLPGGVHLDRQLPLFEPESRPPLTLLYVCEVRNERVIPHLALPSGELPRTSGRRQFVPCSQIYRFADVELYEALDLQEEAEQDAYRVGLLPVPPRVLPGRVAEEDDGDGGEGA